MRRDKSLHNSYKVVAFSVWISIFWISIVFWISIFIIFWTILINLGLFS